MPLSSLAPLARRSLRLPMTRGPWLPALKGSALYELLVMPTWCWEPTSDLQVWLQVLRWVQRGSGVPGHGSAQAGPGGQAHEGAQLGKASLAPAGQPALRARRAAGAPGSSREVPPPGGTPRSGGRTWAAGHTYVLSLGARLYPERPVLQGRHSRYQAKSSWRGPRGRRWEHSPPSEPTSGMASQRLPEPPAPCPSAQCTEATPPSICTERARLPGCGGPLLFSS